MSRVEITATCDRCDWRGRTYRFPLASWRAMHWLERRAWRQLHQHFRQEHAPVAP